VSDKLSFARRNFRRRCNKTSNPGNRGINGNRRFINPPFFTATAAAADPDLMDFARLAPPGLIDMADDDDGGALFDPPGLIEGVLAAPGFTADVAGPAFFVAAAPGRILFRAEGDDGAGASDSFLLEGEARGGGCGAGGRLLGGGCSPLASFGASAAATSGEIRVSFPEVVSAETLDPEAAAAPFSRI